METLHIYNYMVPTVVSNYVVQVGMVACPYPRGLGALIIRMLHEV